MTRFEASLHWSTAHEGPGVAFLIFLETAANHAVATMTPRKRIAVLKSRSKTVKSRRSLAAIMKSRQKEHRIALETEHKEDLIRRRMSTSSRILQKKDQEIKRLHDVIANLREERESGSFDGGEDDDADVDDSTLGSSDPDDPDFDPPSDTDQNLRNVGVQDVMQRAQSFATACLMLTGLSWTQFETIAVEVAPFIARTTLTGEVYVAAPADVTKWVVSPREQVFITLFWARRYQTFAFLAFFFQLPARYVQKVVRRVTSAGAQWAKGRIHLPSYAEARALEAELSIIQANDQTAQILNIDGTPLRVKTPARPRDATREQKAAYNTMLKRLTNAKHNVHAVNLLVITDMLGRIVWLDGPFIGTESQHLLSFKDDLRAKLCEVDLPIASDAGFQLNDKHVSIYESCRQYQTVGPSVVRLAKFVLDNKIYFSADQVEFFQKTMDSTRFVSQGRSVVEHTIADLKTMAVFRGPWRGRIEGIDKMGVYSVRLSDVVSFVGAVVAFRIKQKPKRDKGTFRLKHPPGAVYQYGYPNGVTVQELITLAARQFIPGTKGASRSTKEALEVAQKIAEDKKRAMEGGAAHVPKRARKNAKGDAKNMFPAIVPPEPDDDDDTIYAADVDLENDEPITIRSGGRTKRQQSKAESHQMLAARRARLKK